MKNIFLFIVFITSSFCQHNNCNENINQYATGRDRITFYIFDCETNETLIGAMIYSFNKDKILGTTDLDGIIITDKGLIGNLELSYIGYYSICFQINNTNIDSISLWMKQMPLNYGPGIVDLDTNTISQSKQGEFDAQKDLIDGNIQLLMKSEPTEEQLLFAASHNFEFIVFEGNKSFREAYNEVVIDFLNKKFEKNIEDELRKICCRIYQP
jgi:hypothetical protein